MKILLRLVVSDILTGVCVLVCWFISCFLFFYIIGLKFVLRDVEQVGYMGRTYIITTCGPGF